MREKGNNSDSYLTLLILAYFYFIQDQVQDGFLKSALDMALVILMGVMIIDKSLDLYSRYLLSKKMVRD